LPSTTKLVNEGFLATRSSRSTKQATKGSQLDTVKSTKTTLWNKAVRVPRLPSAKAFTPPMCNHWLNINPLCLTKACRHPQMSRLVTTATHTLTYYVTWYTFAAPD
jgi:hypothetical protein